MQASRIQADAAEISATNLYRHFIVIISNNEINEIEIACAVA